MKLRPGRRNPRNLYIQLGDQPDDRDLPVGFMIDTGMAGLLGDGFTSDRHLAEIRSMVEGRTDQEPGPPWPA